MALKLKSPIALLGKKEQRIQLSVSKQLSLFKGVTKLSDKSSKVQKTKRKY